MRATICDRCGDEVKELWDNTLVKITQETPNGTAQKLFDLCPECKDVVIREIQKDEAESYT